MKNYITAEFDSEDLADLASHKIKYLPGISNMETVQNRFASYNDDFKESYFTTPITPFITGVSNAPIFPYRPLYNVPTDSSVGASGNRSYEPGERRETLLKVELRGDDSTDVSALLRNAGGRHIKVVVS